MVIVACCIYNRKTQQTVFVPVCNMSVYKIFAVTHNNQMEHAYIHVNAFHGSFVKKIYTHNSVLLQASSPTGHSVKAKIEISLQQTTPAFKIGTVKLLAVYMIPMSL